MILRFNFQKSASGPWTSLYLRFLALVLLYGAVEHVGNILGWNGQPWLDTPQLWQVMDILLLVFNILVAVGLWLKRSWAVVGFLGGLITLQWIPYTFFRPLFAQTPDQIQILNGLLGTELILVVALLTLLRLRK